MIMDAHETREVFSPSALNRLVRDLLEDALPPLWLEGEISNLARPTSGHMYFGIKDAGAQIRCAMFRQSGRRLGFVPENGMQVMVRGRVSLYEARGDYQMIVEHMEEAGEGALQREFERLKARLDAEGLFAAERKKPLPAMPRRIGILSSPSGAAVRDVLSVLRRRFPLVQVELMPVPVQGKEAPAAILDMFVRAEKAGRYDVLLLTRGGGSLEDLWAFNDEALVRAIAASRIPVMSAVGHEIDFTLADFAADVRAATPSVAGELLVPDQAALSHHLQQQRVRLHTRLQRVLQAHTQRLDHAQVRLRNQRPKLRLSRGNERLHALQQRLLRAQPLPQLRAHLSGLRTRLDARRLQQTITRLHGQCVQLQQRLCQASTRHLSQQRAGLLALMRSLSAVSPLATLDRGYAILFDSKGQAIRSVQAVVPGAKIEAQLKDGILHLKHIDR